MNDDMHRLSVRLYNALESVGVSEEVRMLHKEWAMYRELGGTLYGRMSRPYRRASWYAFGSSSEGTTSLGLRSDIDFLLCAEDLPVIADVRDAPVGVSLLMITDAHTKPGYLKLQAVLHGAPLTVSNSFHCDHLCVDGCNIITDSEGKYCVSHCSVVGRVGGIIERHGPADTIPEAPGILSHDIVTAYRCKTIPPFADHWVNDVGQYGWPSRQLLDRMKKHGCFVVGVGHPHSDERDIEWRVSFSLQERDIMFSLNPVQHKCYVVLKYIKHDLIKPEIGESLSSYHCKTSLFHVMKTTPPCLWKRDNLVKCVMLCLLKLLKWVRDGHCPNFFVPDENMFDGRVTVDVRTKLEAKLCELLKEGHRFLYRIQCDSIGAILTGMHIIDRYETFRLYTFQMKIRSICDVYDIMLMLYNETYVSSQPLSFLYQALTILDSTRTITEYNEVDTACVKSLLEPLVQVIMAKYLASQTFRLRDAHTRRQYQQFIELYLKHGTGSDLMQARLLQASMLYREDRYGQCSLLLEEIASDLKDQVFSCCSCTNVPIHRNEPFIRRMQSENSSIHALMSTSAVTCVAFSPSEIELIPVALQYELYRTACTPPGSWDKFWYYWFSFAIIDAKIYLHFMQYLVYSKMNQAVDKQAAVRKLIRILETDMYLGHKDTACNLLGWIWMQEGFTQVAFSCFMTSWQIRPYHNAAKWHVAVLVWKCLKDRLI